MIDPLQGREVVARGRGLGARTGDYEPGLRALPGDGAPGTRPLPGDYRMAGSKIKGIKQYDPLIFKKLFA
jgi:hypothetical protein